MTRIGINGIPGVNAALTTSDVEIYWGGDESRITVLRMDSEFVSTAIDATNTPTTLLRKGLIVGKVTSSGLLKEWDPDASDGSENIYGVVDREVDMLNNGSTPVNAWTAVSVCGPVKAKYLRIQGTLLTSSNDEYLARRRLHEIGFRLDDDPQGYKAGIVSRQSVKATSYTVVAADNGTRFYAITADATFTLPTIAAGLHYEFIRASDHELVVASAAGDDMVVGGDLSADSFTFTTAGQQIGATIRVRSVYLNGTLKWLVEQGAVPYSTGALMASAIAT